MCDLAGCACPSLAFISRKLLYLNAALDLRDLLAPPGNRLEALRLAWYFSMSAEVWLRLQARCDPEMAEAKLGNRITQEVKVCERVATGHYDDCWRWISSTASSI